MEKNQIKAVFFDAADTLFRVKGGVGTVYSSVAKKYGANSSPQKIQEAFGKVFKYAPPLAFGHISVDERKICEKRWWHNVVRNVFEEVGMIEKFDNYFDELFETFRRKAWELFPETKDVLSLLKRRGLKLGVISNFDSRVYDVCTDLGIIEFFDSFVISSEAGFAKPSPEIFSLALQINRVTPSECVHIGDSLNLDFNGARTVGIKAFLIDREERYNTRNDIDRIENLADIIRFLDEE